ncbi:UNVERIFIED_CONTAM: Mediator of RNA polymerase II transcription subunit [Sesamum radiatum]|uniref:Mediator of RNA polymerase II transcription subunit n=1 Tax=Sesamum radiatum TaxID=300843 RepID=A0AAW2TVU1_SESRA
MSSKQLIVAVEGTAAIGSFWQTIVSDYLDKIIRCFCGNEPTGQFAISLSVICPKQLPKLRGIYNAGKRNPRAAEPPVDNVKNPHFLVLISENFVEARSSLSRSGMTSLPSNQNAVKTDVAPVPPISGPPSASGPSANASALVRQPISVGNIAPATVKVDMVVFKPQIPNQQQLQQLQQQQPQQQLPQMQQQTQQQHPQMQQQTQQQHPQLQQQPLPVGQLQQQPLMQIQQQQQIPQQQQQQQMVGTAMNQAYIQGGGRPQMLSQGQASSQGSTSMPGGTFIS